MTRVLILLALLIAATPALAGAENDMSSHTFYHLKEQTWSDGVRSRPNLPTSGWTQQKIAARIDKKQSWVSSQVIFGGFLALPPGYHFAGFRRELGAINLRLDNLDRRVGRIERHLELSDAPA